VDTGKGRILTRRELQVLTLVCRGFTNEEISKALRIGLSTVRNYVASIMDKLEARNRTHAAMIAIKKKLVDIPDIE